MARIAPFRALRFSLDKIGDLDAVMAPHYDVISPALPRRSLPVPLLLTRACHSNFSPIFSLYSDLCCAFETLVSSH